MYQGYMRSAFDIIDSSESAPPSATGDRSPNVKQICPFVTDKEAAFLRRLENLPPDQDSSKQIRGWPAAAAGHSWIGPVERLGVEQPRHGRRLRVAGVHVRRLRQRASLPRVRHRI